MQEAQRMIDDAHPITRFSLQMATDPLNFARPFRVASTFLRYGTKGATLGGYKIVRGKTLWDSALIYNAGSWSKRAVLDRTALAAVGGSRFQPAYEAMLAAGRKVTQLRETAVAKASERVATQIRHGFRKPTDPVAAKGWKAKKIPAKQRAAIDAALPKVEAALESAPELRQLLDSAVSNRLSLYVDSGYSTYSIIGAALLANLIEKGRVSTIHQFATRSADDVSARLQDLPDAERIAALNAEYGRIVDEAGFYVVGGRGTSYSRTCWTSGCSRRWTRLSTSSCPPSNASSSGAARFPVTRRQASGTRVVFGSGVVENTRRL